MRTPVSEIPVLPSSSPHSRAPRSGVSLLFPEGRRPSAQTVAALLDSFETSGIAARISHRPPDGEGWLELLASGLTFDLVGLAPAPFAAPEDMPHRYGFEGKAGIAGLEAVELRLGGHAAGGARLLPVVRTMAGLAAGLALKLPVAAVCWQSAQTVMEPRYYARVVMNWLAGGAFPALGLTALVSAEDGSIASRGLARFIGQEMQLEGKEGEPPADTVKLGVRVIDYLVRQGGLTAPREIEGAEGRLLAEPSGAGRQIWVWRDR